MGIHGTPLKTVVRWNKLSLLSIIGIKAYFELQLLHRRPGGLPDRNRAQSLHRADIVMKTPAQLRLVPDTH